MAHPAKRRATYDDYLAVPAHQTAEIINGELHVFPRPAPRHAHAASVLGAIVLPPFMFGDDGPGGWLILHEPELQLVPREPVSPDLAGWCVERLPALPEEAYFSLAPDWVCEVLSKSPEKLDRDEKMPLYAAHGVPHAWLVDPVKETLETYALTNDRTWMHTATHHGAARVRVPPFEEVAIDLGRLWAPQPPRSR